MSNSLNEISQVCYELGIKFDIIDKIESEKIINEVFALYKVRNKAGSIGIYNQSVSIPIESNEFTYSENLLDEPILMFFPQNDLDKGKVILIEEGRKLCEIMKNAFGMQYFITNEIFSYLIAVNWYVIEGAGNSIDWLKKLGAK